MLNPNLNLAPNCEVDISTLNPNPDPIQTLNLNVTLTPNREVDMVKGVMELRDECAGDHMTPIDKCAMLDVTDKLDMKCMSSISRDALSSPIYKGDLRIKGVLSSSGSSPLTRKTSSPSPPGRGLAASCLCLPG